MADSLQIKIPTMFCALMLLVASGCDQRPKPPRAAPSPSLVDAQPPKNTPEPAVAPTPRALPANARAILMMEGLSAEQMTCSKWDHVSRRVLEERGQTSCKAWFRAQSRIQKNQSPKTYHVPKDGMFIARLNPETKATPEIIAWHVKHRAFLTMDCSSPLPQGLVYVNCGSQPVNGEHLSAVSTIRHMKTSFNKGTKGALSKIGKMSQLESLYIESSKLDAESLGHLNGLSNLRALHLVGVGLDDAGAAQLKGLTSLTELVISSNKGITEKGLKHIANLKSLKTLDLSSITSLSNKGLSLLAALPSLEHLSCPGVGSSKLGFSAKGLHPVGKLKNLTYLNTGFLSIDAKGAKRIGGLTKLIAFEGALLSGAMLASFGGLSALESLVLEGDLGAGALGGLKGLKSLRSLSIGLDRLKQAQPIDDASLRHISTFSGLRSLRIEPGFAKPSTITDDGIAHLKTLKNLHHLSVVAAAVTSKGLEPLTALPLRNLDVSRTKVDSDALPSLLALTKLENLRLNRSAISKETKTALQEGLPACKEKRCSIAMISLR